MSGYKNLLSLALWVASIGSCAAQVSADTKYRLSGTITDDKQQAVTDVVVQLLRQKDSALVKTEFSDEKGLFTFDAVPEGTYFLQTNILNYNKYVGAAIDLRSDLTLPAITLDRNSAELNEVVVAARKPYIEREHGKTILNVENSINAAGSSVFELIEKAPGVNVDNNDNISLRGRQGIIVQINGKPTPMTGSDLANYLRGIPSNAIEKIEFISNPSAKYDAAGSAIINIKLKKDTRLGTNGSIVASYGQGVYPKSNDGIGINHRDKKVNVFASYNYAYRDAFNNLKLDRRFYQNDTFTGAYRQNNYLFFPMRNHIGRAGADFTLTDRHSLGFVVNGVSNRFKPSGDNTSDVYDQNDNMVSRFNTINNSDDNWYNYSINVNDKYVLDSTGAELTTDLDYAHFGNKTIQNFTTRYLDLNNQEYTTPYLLYGNIKGGLDIYSIKSDFSKPFKNNLRMEAGVKSSYVTADNNLAFYNRSLGQNIYDSTKSNHFIYKENINAAYVSASKDWKKWSTQLGLRCEHTHVTGTQLVYNTTFDTNYVQLFPNAYIGYKFNDKHSIELTYSRRINRPGYDQLNPFKFFLDPTTYKEGNPYLKPQTTHSWDLSYVLKQQIYFTLGYGRTLNNITEVLAPSPTQQNITVQTNINLRWVDVYAFNAAIPYEITKWWYTSNDINVYYAGYTGNVARTQIRNKGNVTYNINTVNTFNITQSFSAELSANYRSREIYAYDVINPIWYVSAGVQKKFMGNKAVVKLNISDIFFTNQTTADVTFTDYKESFVVKRETRVATLSLTYKFGKNTVAPARRRGGGAEDIKQRAGNTGVG